MATKEEIRRAILEVAGNPTSGAVADLADAFAEAVAALDAPPSEAIKETRIIRAAELR